jgi:hypothetical protein
MGTCFCYPEARALSVSPSATANGGGAAEPETSLTEISGEIPPHLQSNRLSAIFAA